jgi:hypothetical protein
MVEPRVLISIDYEPWVAMRQREFNYATSEKRMEIDDCYTADSLDELLDILNGKPISIYLLGEIALWYPQVPEKIKASGHELGFHGHFHRTLLDVADLELGLQLSKSWIEKYNVRGFRAPILRINKGAYNVLANAGFHYSSSIYGPTGRLQKIENIWEIPVSTFSPIKKEQVSWWFPRDFSPRLFSQFEFPFGSSMMIGMLGDNINYWIEKELKQGKSPILVLHNYQLVQPDGWPRQMQKSFLWQPWVKLFTISRRRWLEEIISRFPVGTVGGWLDEVIQERQQNRD